MAVDRQQVNEDQRAPAAHVRPGDPGHAAFPVGEAEYWREAYAQEPYYEPGRSFADYGTAYELGWVSYHLYGGEFETAERVLANDWIVRKGVSMLAWDDARPAVRAAWQRAHNARSFASNGTASPDQVKASAKGLFESARDGELGLREAAAHARQPELAAVFERLALQCAAAALQWQGQLSACGDTADDGGTVAGAAQRVWLQLRSLFGGAGDATLLDECERGLDDMAAQYREALSSNLPAHLHAAVQREYEQLQRQHDHVRSLRDRGVAALRGSELPA